MKINLTLREMRASDWEEVRAIYLAGLATRQATFETEAPAWERWDANHLARPRLVAIREDDLLAGWAALTPVSGRAVYRGVAEVSVYVAAEVRGHGVGRSLLNELCGQSEQCGTWTLQASIFPENKASLALHKSLGFREVGRREKIGQLDGVWRDTILLERRSAVVGVK